MVSVHHNLDPASTENFSVQWTLQLLVLNTYNLGHSVDQLTLDLPPIERLLLKLQSPKVIQQNLKVPTDEADQIPMDV